MLCYCRTCHDYVDDKERSSVNLCLLLCIAHINYTHSYIDVCV